MSWKACRKQLEEDGVKNNDVHVYHINCPPLHMCLNNTWRGERKLTLLLIYYAVSWDGLYSNRQVKRTRNGCETAGKTSTTGL